LRFTRIFRFSFPRGWSLHWYVGNRISYGRHDHGVGDRRAYALHTGVRPELLTIATGAGSLIFSHFNDGGFWIVKEYFGMSVAQTLKSCLSPRLLFLLWRCS